MTAANAPQKKFPLIPVIFVVVAVLLITVVTLTFDDGGSGSETGSPEVSGQVLPRLPEGGADPAIGAAIPNVTGADFEENPVAISNDGNAKIILFLAHWCPHCQREVPIVQDWLDTDPLPEGLDFYAVATSISSTRENYPPSSWLDREGWSTPVIVDDEASSVAASYGLSAFPYWVFADADGTVMLRLSGGIAPDDLDSLATALVAQPSG